MKNEVGLKNGRFAKDKLAGEIFSISYLFNNSRF